MLHHSAAQLLRPGIRHHHKDLQQRPQVQCHPNQCPAECQDKTGIKALRDQRTTGP